MFQKIRPGKPGRIHQSVLFLQNFSISSLMRCSHTDEGQVPVSHTGYRAETPAVIGMHHDQIYLNSHFAKALDAVLYMTEMIRTEPVEVKMISFCFPVYSLKFSVVRTEESIGVPSYG